MVLELIVFVMAYSLIGSLGLVGICGGGIGKFHITCLNSWSMIYISVGQLCSMPLVLG